MYFFFGIQGSQNNSSFSGNSGMPVKTLGLFISGGVLYKCIMAYFYTEFRQTPNIVAVSIEIFCV
jgi:hypothetical protein